MVKGIEEITYLKKDVILFNSYFRNNNVVLSNHYDKCKIDYEGLIFHSSEQLFFWILLEGDEVGREKVMEAPTAKECLKVGRKFLKKRGWDVSTEEAQRAEVKALRLAIGEKMRCCKEFRDFVLGSGDKKIVEYCTWGDNDYGAVDLDENLKWNLKEGYVRGRNICGRIIQQWRKWYRENKV